MALLELFRVTGNDDYWEGAKQAFAYERHWFGVATRSWPDFREERGAFKRSIHPSGFGNTWRHGAPGIVLSRLRAYQLTRDITCRTESLAGLQSTRETAREWLQLGAQDYSPCNGLAGHAEILTYGQQVLGKDCDDGNALALACASLAIQVHSKRNRAVTWERGGADTPGFISGLAGIGYCYLRLRDPQTPSILIPFA